MGSVIDLTTIDSFGSLNGAVFVQSHIAPSGSGALQSFVRINPGGSQSYEQGYNTAGRPLQYDENNSPTFTHELLLSTIPIVTCAGGNIPGCTDGTGYREFRLDINQQNSDPLLSLDRVVLFLRDSPSYLDANVAHGGSLGALGSALFSNGTFVYDSGLGNRVDLNFTLEPGSGGGDMVLLVPNTLFSGPNPFVYLYSEFGGSGAEPPFQANAGFEEWAVHSSTSTQSVPEPSTVAHFGITALIGVSRLLWKRRTTR
jgi:hypothetical protein